MNAQEIITNLHAKGARFELDRDGFRVRAPQGLVTESMREALITYKAEIVCLLITESNACPNCAVRLRTSEADNHTAFECSANPLHYSEIRRKPGTDRLWSDVPLPAKAQSELFS